MRNGWPFYGLCAGVWLAALVAIPWWNSFPATQLRLVVFLGTFAGMLLLLVAIGISICQTPLGVLRSGRNAYSLSRLQMALWTLLVLSALIGAATSRAWGIGGAGSINSALSINIPGELLVAMGISYFTGFASPAVLAIKAQTASTAGQVNLASNRLNEPIYAVGSVVQRPLDRPARVADMVSGDDLETAGTIDLSKVQQLLITLLLIGTYFVMLIGLFVGDNFSAMGSGPSPTEFTPLPEFSENFLTLLALSHAGYLAYKVAPKAQATSNGANVPTLRPPPPDRLVP